MLCRGPLAGEMHSAYTFLLGAVARDFKLDPSDAVERADRNREDLLRHPDWRTTNEPFA